MATVELTQENFESVMSKSPIIILDFWAPWCGPCKSFGPVFEAASKLHPDIVFGKINTEEQQELAGMFGIRSIPTIAAFRDQIGVYMQPGALPPKSFEDLIGQIKALDMNTVRQQMAEQETKAKA
jgi:thioredoxin 1